MVESATTVMHLVQLGTLWILWLLLHVIVGILSLNPAQEHVRLLGVGINQHPHATKVRQTR